MAMKLTPYQAKILEFLFGCLPMGEGVDTLDFALKGDFRGRYFAAHAPLKDSDASVVFNLPIYSESVFIGLSRSDPKHTSLLLANLEDYERESGLRFKSGDVAKIPARASGNADPPFALLLMKTAVASECANVPGHIRIAGKDTSFFLVVPISEGEDRIRAESGHGALMEAFEGTNKDIFF